MRLTALFLAVSFAALGDGPPAVTYTITTVAGGTFCGDGRPGPTAYLGAPEGIAVDAAGNVYISDAADHRIRKLDANSGVISTVAGDGHPGLRGDGGPADAAQLSQPYGLALDGAGNLYIADYGNSRVRKISGDGKIRTVVGGGAAGGTEAEAARLRGPRNLAVDRDGNLYISDYDDHRVYKVTPSGSIERVAGLGRPGAIPDAAPVAATLAELSGPAGLAVDAAGALYIADSGNGSIRKVQGGLMSTVPANGIGLVLPTGLAFDAAGNLYVADKKTERVVRLTPAPGVAVAGDGTRGSSGDGGLATLAQLAEPRDIAFNARGDLYIADRYAAGLVRAVRGGVIVTVAGGAEFRPLGDDGSATQAHLDAPAGIALAPDGSLYIADQNSNRVRRVAAGFIETVAGDGTAGVGGDGGLGTAAQTRQPLRLALDAAGALYMVEASWSVVRRLDAAGVIARVAGLDDPRPDGYSGDGGPAVLARLNYPEGIAADTADNVYIADTYNHVVRRVLPDGTITTIAGKGVPGYGGDGGPATSALLFNPRGMAADRAGNLYIADSDNHVVRRIDSHGMISTVAGTGAAWFGGDGGAATAATLKWPSSVAADGAGNLYIADTGNHRVRKVAANGVITTIAGTGIAGYGGDGGPGPAADLREPADLAVDAGGNVFVADSANNRIRKLAPSSAPAEPPGLQVFNLVSAASLLPGAVAPGELVSIYGTALGPAKAVRGELAAPGVLGTKVAETEVLFNGTRAALLSVQYSRIDLQVPYEVAGSAAAQVELTQGGETVAKFVAAVTDAAPGIFTVDGGAGLAAAVNQDGTANSAGNPAAPGSVLTLYATGEGQTMPAGVDGKLAVAPLPEPVLPVSVGIGGIGAEVLFAAAAPGYAGLVQVNVRVPGALKAGRQNVELRVGTAASPAGAATIFCAMR